MNEHLLSEDQVQFFKDEGYIVANDVIPHEVLDAVSREISVEIDRRARVLHERGELSDLYENDGFETRLAKISQETDKLALSIWNHVLHGPEIFNLITNEHVVDLAEQIVGPEVIASSVYRLRPKIPNYGYGAVPWHQDSAYFEPFCDAHLILTFWIPLVDADESNGCLYVIPRSHLGGVVKHSADKSGKYLAIDEDVLPDPEKKVACPVRKGGVLIMTNRTAHASFRNTTDGVRWSMDLRYQAADLPTNAQITRLEHEQTESVEAGVPAACYPPEADFLVRSTARPDEVLRTPEAFARLREKHVPRDVTNRFHVTWKEPAVIDL
jgi:phytanoyl-CoA hydroxylase